ncbi:MAG: adenine phosphoribosyltransferase [Myxococcota bacterium]
MPSVTTQPPLPEPLRQARRLIREIPNFPKQGVLFRDITPLLQDPAALALVMERLETPWQGSVELVAGIESRGFIFGALLAQRLGAGFVPIRKPGKLPFKTESVSYGLEYGTDTLEIHIDSCRDRRVLLCDDLLATGGTASAAATLVERVGGKVAGYCFAIELLELRGRARLHGARVESLFTF